ncbi:hypothetical protein OAO01_04645 [Oligoflexia bacterium]|nr:hypothetical protein [Oligoflexia bacterium]
MQLNHLLGIENLSKDELYLILDNAQKFIEVSQRQIKKVPALRGKTVVNLFLTPNQKIPGLKTLASFEIASKRLSADTITISESNGYFTDGESLVDIACALQDMAADVLVVSHGDKEGPAFLAKKLEYTSVLNAGDTTHEHPTQALIDCLALAEHFEDRAGGIENLRIAVLGDASLSAIGRSNVFAHLLLGNHVTVHQPQNGSEAGSSGNLEPGWAKHIQYTHILEESLSEADVILALPINGRALKGEAQHSNHQLTEEMLTRYAPDSVVLCCGPQNGADCIPEELRSSERSLADRQSQYAVAVRMAVLFLLSTGKKSVDMEASVT